MTYAPTAPHTIAYGTENIIIICFWLLICSSGIVHFEPAPFDLGFIAMFGLALLFGIRVPKSIVLMIAVLGVWLVFSLIGTSQAPASDLFNDTVRHMQITALLIAVAVFIASFIYRFRDRAIQALMNGWVIAALVAALAGILAYFDVLGSRSEDFLLYGRAKGTFKDPNVLAPFLIPPAIYCVYHAASRSTFWALVNLGVLAILSLAILLSFSRGGWGHFAFSGLVAVILWLLTVQNRRFKQRLFAFTAIAGCVLGFALVMLLDVEGVSGLFLERIASQPYDSAANGRFAGQYLTFLKALENPLGLGAHGFLPDWYEQPHNVYLFQFIIGGWGGGFTYFAFVVITLAKSFAFLRQRTPHSAIMIVLFSSFLGLAIEGAIVDSDHWRHFWILTGAIWGIIAIHAQPISATQAAAASPNVPPQPLPQTAVGQTPLAEPLRLRSSLE